MLDDEKPVPLLDFINFLRISSHTEDGNYSDDEPPKHPHRVKIGFRPRKHFRRLSRYGMIAQVFPQKLNSKSHFLYNALKGNKVHSHLRLLAVRDCSVLQPYIFHNPFFPLARSSQTSSSTSNGKLSSFVWSKVCNESSRGSEILRVLNTLRQRCKFHQ